MDVSSFDTPKPIDNKFFTNPLREASKCFANRMNHPQSVQNFSYDSSSILKMPTPLMSLVLNPPPISLFRKLLIILRVPKFLTKLHIILQKI